MTCWTMKIFDKVDIGFWTGFLAVIAGTAWLVYGIVALDTFFVYPLALILFGILAVVKFDSGLIRKRSNQDVLDDELSTSEEE